MSQGDTKMGGEEDDMSYKTIKPECRYCGTRVQHFGQLCDVCADQEDSDESSSARPASPKSKHPNSTPIYKNGHRWQINGMAASSIANKFYDVSRCDECSELVAWAQGKGGGWYLCKVMEYPTDEGHEKTKAAPWIRHECGEVYYELSSSDGWRIADYGTREEAIAARDAKAEETLRSAYSLFEHLDDGDFEGLAEEAKRQLRETAEGLVASAATITKEWKIVERRKVS